MMWYILKILIEKNKSVSSPVKFPAKSPNVAMTPLSQSALEEASRPDRSALNPRVLFAATLW